MKLYLLFLLIAIYMMTSAHALNPAVSPYPNGQDKMQFGVVVCTPMYDTDMNTDI